MSLWNALKKRLCRHDYGPPEILGYLAPAPTLKATCVKCGFQRIGLSVFRCRHPYRREATAP